MSETTQTTQPPADAEPTPIAIAAAKDKGASLYMLLWAPIPDLAAALSSEPQAARDRILAWRELGWIQAHDPEQAKAAGMAVVRAATAEEMPEADPRERSTWQQHEQHSHVELALQGKGLKLRAIARRGWVEETSIEPTRLVNNPQLVIG